MTFPVSYCILTITLNYQCILLFSSFIIILFYPLWSACCVIILLQYYNIIGDNTSPIYCITVCHKNMVHQCDITLTLYVYRQVVRGILRSIPPQKMVSLADRDNFSEFWTSKFPNVLWTFIYDFCVFVVYMFSMYLDTLNIYRNKFNCIKLNPA